jgi:hypothetical protein
MLMATLTIPSNENGLALDQAINGVIADAINVDPFGFDDVVIYSHGWSTDADSAMVEYDIFTVGLTRRLLLAPADGIVLSAPPKTALDIGIHWPSEISEDPNSPLNDLQLFTFYTMEHRAEAVGKNLVYSILRIALAARSADQGLRFLLLGHSFGCKVMCAALQDMQVDISGGTIAVAEGTSFRVVLLEPATDWDNLEPGDIYGDVSQIANLRVLMTTSQRDLALTQWYPDAARIANLFHGANPTPALGAAGPTQATIDAFGGADQLSVNIGFGMPAVMSTTNRLVVADLTAAHTARLTGNPPAYTTGGLSGSHSDINFLEIYNLVGGFLFTA